MKIFKYWLAVLGWCGVIFYLSSLPQVTTGITVWDMLLAKFAHMTEYFILALLLHRALKASFSLSRFCLIFWFFVPSALYAVFDEIHQFFVPTRVCSFEDVIVDIIGIAAFCIYQFS